MKFTLLGLIIALATFCVANEEAIEYAKVRPVNSLSGTVIDQTGAPIPQVQVLEMSADGKTVLRSTPTDEQGRWTFQPTPGRNTYRVQFSKGGFRQVWMRLKLTKRRAKPLSVEMPVA
jgi:Carboxypeptidase regulatory-like domain